MDRKLKRQLKKWNKKPKRCPDPVMKYCQDCRWGGCIYPDYVETYADLEGCTFETYCILGFENQEPTKKEIRKFNKWRKKADKLYKKRHKNYLETD